MLVTTMSPEVGVPFPNEGSGSKSLLSTNVADIGEENSTQALPAQISVGKSLRRSYTRLQAVVEGLVDELNEKLATEIMKETELVLDTFNFQTELQTSLASPPQSPRPPGLKPLVLSPRSRVLSVPAEGPAPGSSPEMAAAAAAAASQAAAQAAAAAAGTTGAPVPVVTLSPPLSPTNEPASPRTRLRSVGGNAGKASVTLSPEAARKSSQPGKLTTPSGGRDRGDSTTIDRLPTDEVSHVESKADMVSVTTPESPKSSNRLSAAARMSARFHQQQQALAGSRQFSSIFRVVSEDSESATNVLRFLLTSWEFETSMGVCILLNCFSIGFQAHQHVAASFGSTFTTLLEVTEHTFTAIFVLEILLRLAVFGREPFVPRNLEGRLMLLDAFLVLITGVFANWIMPLGREVFSFEQNDNDIYLRILQVLRALRVGRVARLVGEVPWLEEAWTLLRGLANSARVLFWTVIVIFFITYGFAILGLTFVVEPLQDARAGVTTAAEEEVLDSLLPLLNGLDKMMFTLIQVLMQDSFHSIMRNILPFVPASWVFFYSYMMIGCLVLMNLVTAIIVENASETAKNDRETILKNKLALQNKEFIELKNLFEAMDKDGSGTLSWAEFRNSFQDADMSRKWVLLDVHPDQCKELFALLDDGDGEIDASEFFDGIQHLQGQASSKELFQLDKKVSKLAVSLKSLHSGVRSILSRIERGRQLKDTDFSTNLKEI